MPEEPIVNLVLRLPQSAHAACMKQAAKQHRSLNSQLVTIVEEWLDENAPQAKAEKVRA
jgi:hypothetical protein